MCADCTPGARRESLGRILKAGLFVFVLLLGAAEAQSTQGRSPVRSAWDGVFFHAQADRGEVDFFKHCARYHSGSGDGPILSSEEFLITGVKKSCRRSLRTSKRKCRRKAGSLSYTENTWISSPTFCNSTIIRPVIRTCYHRNWTGTDCWRRWTRSHCQAARWFTSLAA